ncbi:MAG: M28 family metallopeptidase [Bacteroidales bacterium]|nr:M28 family metallopeptidase [Bacteroidales bacterium]
MRTQKSLRNYLLPAIVLVSLMLQYGCGSRERVDIPVFCDNFRTHVETLASDEMEGRAPATRGAERAIEYIKGEYKRIGLKPALGDTYLQPVPLVEITGYDFSDLTIRGKGSTLSYKYLDDMVIGTNRLQNRSSLRNSELVFVGYGVVAPEYGWNDYEGVDVKGKTVVVMINDPGFAIQDEEMFNGRAMTYYGRWTYKFEEAARQGAKGALIIHQTEPASYGWTVVRNSWSGTQYGIGIETGDPHLEAEGWIQLDVAREIFELAGHDLDDMLEAAASPGFQAFEMGMYANVDFKNVFEYSECYNIIGYIEGSEYPDETVIYMAHWDHLGMVETEDGVDIYNGAVDNATGVGAILSIAGRMLASGEAPKRSVAFLAVTAEESGLLGSKFYAANPVFPLETTVGGLNIDALNVYGATWDVSVVGYGNSEMEDYLRKHATAQGRYLAPEPTPEAGYFYRSDHISLARQGVPMIYAQGGVDYIGRDEAYAEMVAEDLAGRYHAPTDIVHDMWVWEGMHQDMWLFYHMGMDLANSRSWPNWYDGNEFRQLRDSSADARSR